MAEETPAVRNKGLLIAAIILAVLVVVLYNWQVSRVRREGRGETFQLAVLRRNIAPGEKMEFDDFRIETIVISKEERKGGQFKKSLGDVIILRRGGTDREKLADVLGVTVNQTVRRGQYLRWHQITGHPSGRPSYAIPKGMVAFTLPLEPRMAPGTVLSVGDRITVWGMLALREKAKVLPLDSYPIMEKVPVLAIGGVANRDMSGTRGASYRREGRRTYRSVTIAVPPDMAGQLINVLSHVRGGITLVVCSPEDRPENQKPRIHPKLRELKAWDAGLPGMR